MANPPLSFPKSSATAATERRAPGAGRLAYVAALALMASSACAEAQKPPPAHPAPEPLPRDAVAQAAHEFSGVKSSDKTALTSAELLETLGGFTAICFGESHTEPAHHFAQWTVLRSLLPAKRPLALGMEMFQLPVQTALDEYVAGTLEETPFLERTQYEKLWGYDFSLYRPLLEEARSAHVPVIALNTPRDLTKAVAKGGLEALTAEQKAALPELDTKSAEHRAFFDEAMGGHPMEKHSVDNFYLAQVLWDETMANTAAQWLKGAVDRQMLIVAGKGHCHNAAIPARLRRRGIESVVSVWPVTPEEQKELEAEPEQWGRADYYWIVGAPSQRD